MSDALAVVVGIDRYPDALLGPLRGAINDAEAFCDWLNTPAGGGLVETASRGTTEIYKILSLDDGSDVFDARPTLTEIESALDRVKHRADTRVREWEAGDRDSPFKRLYLFFAGHGIGPDVDQAALLMANAGEGRFGYCLPGRPYANYFLARQAFDEVVLFMDCCRDRNPVIAAQPLKWSPPDPAGRDPNHCFGFATKWAKKSREVEIGGRHRGVFSAAVVEALNGSAADASGKVTADGLERYVTARIPKLTQKSQQAQFAYPNQSPMVLADYGAAVGPRLTEVVISVSPGQQAAPLTIVNDTLQPARVFEEQRTPARWKFRVPFGVYRIQDTTTAVKSPPFEAVGPETVHVAY